jgi:hypothetical protein
MMSFRNDQRAGNFDRETDGNENGRSFQNERHDSGACCTQCHRMPISSLRRSVL